MIRTQIQLPEAKYEKLRRVAARNRQSMAECIREGIDAFLQHTEEEEADLGAFAGSFRPNADPNLKDHDRWWADTVAKGTGTPPA
jgi:Arc/MetJ-type ribon-helix-helix transcriptional regulator